MRRATIALLLVLALGSLVLVASGCSRPGADLPMPDDVARETTETAVVYATGRSLYEERHIVDAENVYLSTLEKWLEAMPTGNLDIALVQPQSRVLGAELDDEGVLTIDWSFEVLEFEATPDEQLIALAGLLRTLGQFPEVEYVRFTVEGEIEGEIGGRSVEAFWGDVTLAGQPWEAIRPTPRASESATDTS